LKVGYSQSHSCTVFGCYIRSYNRIFSKTRLRRIFITFKVILRAISLIFANTLICSFLISIMGYFFSHFYNNNSFEVYGQVRLFFRFHKNSANARTIIVKTKKCVRPCTHPYSKYFIIYKVLHKYNNNLPETRRFFRPRREERAAFLLRSRNCMRFI